MDRRFEIGVIIGHLEMIWNEEYIRNDILELKKILSLGDYMKAAKYIGNIEMKSSDDEVLCELNRLWNIIYSKCPDLDSPIKELKLSDRTYNCLMRARITTIRELSELPIEKLSRIRNLTQKGRKEICDKMNAIGIEIKE